MSEFEEKRPQAQGQADIDAFADRTPTAGKTAQKPKKSWVKWAAILGAVAVLAAAVAILPGLLKEPEPVDPPGEDTLQPATLVDKQTDEAGEAITDPVREVKITSRLDAFTLTAGEDGVIRLEGDEDIPLNATEVNDLINKLTLVEAEDTVATGVTDPADYGLTAPTASVEVTYADGETVTLDMAALAVSKKYYLRVNGGDTVYLISRTLPEAVIRPVEDFVGLSVISAPSVSPDDANGTALLKELSLTGPVRDNVVTTLRRKEEGDSEEFVNTNFLLTAPYLMATDATATTELFAVTSIYAEEAVVLHPTEEQLAEYGLDRPRSIAKLVMAVYTSVTDEDGNTVESGYYNEMTHLVRLGKLTEDGSCYYCMADLTDVIYRITADSVPWAEKTYHDFANQYLFLRHLDTLRSIACTLDGKEYDFRFEHFPEAEELDDRLRVTVDGQVYDTDEFRTLYQVLMTLFRTGPAPAQPEGDPLLTVRITSLDESFSVSEIAIYPYSGSVYIARTEQGDTYKVTASRVDDAMEQIRRYLRGEPVINRF